MNQRLLITLLLAVFLGIGVLIFFNVYELLHPDLNETYLSYSHVKGIAVSHKKQLYTLNFEQQNDLIRFLNRSKPVGKTAFAVAPMQIDKIVIYQFQGPDLELIPITFYNDNMIFSLPEWNQDGFLKDTSDGQLRELLSETYDP